MVLFYVLIVCTVTLPPGVNPIAVDKYIYLSINPKTNLHNNARLPVSTAITYKSRNRCPVEVYHCSKPVLAVINCKQRN